MAEYKKSCYDCIHCDVCGGIGFCSYHCSDVSMCKYFKDKSLITGLPCKVGDKVFMTTPNDVLEMEVIQIKISAHWTVFDCVHVVYDEYEEFFYERDFGKSVFLTREEAEQALKERE